MIYALFILFVVAVCTGLAIGVLWEAIDRWSDREVDRADDRAADIAADTLARQKRQDAANAIAFEVRAAFLSQMTPEQQMRAELDRDDAVARIAGWGL